MYTEYLDLEVYKITMLAKYPYVFRSEDISLVRENIGFITKEEFDELNNFVQEKDKENFYQLIENIKLDCNHLNINNFFSLYTSLNELENKKNTEFDRYIHSLVVSQIFNQERSNIHIVLNEFPFQLVTWEKSLATNRAKEIIDKNGNSWLQPADKNKEHRVFIQLEDVDRTLQQILPTFIPNIPIILNKEKTEYNEKIAQMQLAEFFYFIIHTKIFNNIMRLNRIQVVEETHKNSQIDLYTLLHSFGDRYFQLKLKIFGADYAKTCNTLSLSKISMDYSKYWKIVCQDWRQALVCLVCDKIENSTNIEEITEKEIPNLYKQINNNLTMKQHIKSKMYDPITTIEKKEYYIDLIFAQIADSFYKFWQKNVLRRFKICNKKESNDSKINLQDLPQHILWKIIGFYGFQFNENIHYPKICSQDDITNIDYLYPITAFAAVGEKRKQNSVEIKKS